MSNFNYLREIYGRSHIVLFFFLFCFARTSIKKLPTLHPLTNRSFCKHHADDKIDRQKIDCVTAKNRPTLAERDHCRSTAGITFHQVRQPAVSLVLTHSAPQPAASSAAWGYEDQIYILLSGTALA